MQANYMTQTRSFSSHRAFEESLKLQGWNLPLEI